MNNNVITLSGLNKSFKHQSGDNPVLKQINLQIKTGEMIAILGASGSGKSTLLSILGLLDIADTGNYKLCNQDVSALSAYQLSQLRNQHIGWIFQNFNLIADMTVAENLAVPLRYNTAVNSAQYAERINNVLTLVELADRSSFYPDELSGGQQQRVAIARALICEPDILLCDEPTGNLDSSNAAKIMSLLGDLHKKGKTILIITHDNTVAECCEKAYKMHDGELSPLEDEEYKRAV